MVDISVVFAIALPVFDKISQVSDVLQVFSRIGKINILSLNTEIFELYQQERIERCDAFSSYFRIEERVVISYLEIVT